MSSDKERTNDDDGDETSKMSVLVPETAQDDNRSLVLYDHDGSKRNKLGPDTTDRLTHALAMEFWRHPSKLEKVAQSEYVDDAEAFKHRIKKYQEKHLDDTLVVARELLHGSIGQTERANNGSEVSEPHGQRGGRSRTFNDDDTTETRLGGVPRAEDARRDQTIPQQTRSHARKELEEELDELISEKVAKELRESMEVFQRRFDQRLSKIENAVSGSDSEQDTEK